MRSQTYSVWDSSRPMIRGQISRSQWASWSVGPIWVTELTKPLSASFSFLPVIVIGPAGSLGAVLGERGLGGHERRAEKTNPKHLHRSFASDGSLEIAETHAKSALDLAFAAVAGSGAL